MMMGFVHIELKKYTSQKDLVRSFRSQKVDRL